MGMSWLNVKTVIHKAYKAVGKNGLLSLSDLSYHGLDGLEHDSSLSRLDAALSDNQQDKFNQERFNTFLSFSKDGKFLTTEDVAAARLYFLADSKANNPHFLWNENFKTVTWVETAGLLHILGKDGRISVEDAKVIFEKETFPPGWQKPDSFGVIGTLSAVRALTKAADEHEKQQRIKHNDT
ncbi:unnamed protein product [Adineta steineri]|uniref:Heme haloperoxidase family profile domain-containing protein n=1 Tax=Adineta steineri TaxID=433720 RepID=A0A813MYM5_9BILA|nr:unnamed protein product [Adineta steineri]CAF3897104.1 unnamed protein product [Adineta steineri]